MNETDVMVPSKEIIERDIQDFNSLAFSVVVSDSDSYVLAKETFLLGKEMEKKIKEFFKPLKEKSYAAWKALCNAENVELEKLTPGLNHLKRPITDYEIEQEKIRKAEEERLRQEAVKAEEERRMQEALQLEKEGHKEEAQAVIEEEPFIPTPVVEKTIPKVAGTATRKEWKFMIKNEDLIPRKYMSPNLVAIGGTVRSQKDKTEISGVEVYCEYIPVSTGRR